MFFSPSCKEPQALLQYQYRLPFSLNAYENNKKKSNSMSKYFPVLLNFFLRRIPRNFRKTFESPRMTKTAGRTFPGLAIKSEMSLRPSTPK